MILAFLSLSLSLHILSLTLKTLHVFSIYKLKSQTAWFCYSDSPKYFTQALFFSHSSHKALSVYPFGCDNILCKIIMDFDMIRYEEDGSLRLPVGYQFDPTDRDLLEYYLTKKVQDQNLPAEIIREFDVYQTEPWSLPGGGRAYKEKRYFFFNLNGRKFENMDKRPAGGGEWRTEEKDKGIQIPQNTQVMGMRNTLVFWEVQGNRDSRTNWVMQEFRLALLADPSQMSNWAVYRIFKKKEAAGKVVKKAKRENGSNKPTVIDFFTEKEEGGNSVSAPPPSPSPSTP